MPLRFSNDSLRLVQWWLRWEYTYHIPVKVYSSNYYLLFLFASRVHFICIHVSSHVISLSFLIQLISLWTELGGNIVGLRGVAEVDVTATFVLTTVYYYLISKKNEYFNDSTAAKAAPRQSETLYLTAASTSNRGLIEVFLCVFHISFGQVPETKGATNEKPRLTECDFIWRFFKIRNFAFFVTI